jgi:hypothetical protein
MNKIILFPFVAFYTFITMIKLFLFTFVALIATIAMEIIFLFTFDAKITFFTKKEFKITKMNRFALFTKNFPKFI